MGEHVDENHKIETELQMKLEEDDLKCKQREKQLWLRNGDNNTNFTLCIQTKEGRQTRSPKSWIQKGILTNDQAKIGGIFSNYFS